MSPQILYTNVNSNLIHNSPKLKTAECPKPSEQLNNLQYILSSKNKQITNMWNHMEEQNMLRKIERHKSIYSMIPFTWNPRKGETTSL